MRKCLDDPEIRRDAESSYACFEEEARDEYRRRHNIPPGLLGAALRGLQRLSIEQYVLNLLKRRPEEKSWDDLASTIASIGEVIGDPTVREKAWNEVSDIRAEMKEMAETRGDSGSPAVIRHSLVALNEMLSAAKARLVEEMPGIDRPGFTKTYPRREWPIAAFGKTKQYGRQG